MATVNISALFENNLRKVSEVGVGTFQAEIGSDGNRLGQGIVYAKGGDEHLIYAVPKESIVPKFYLIVDEVFDAGTTATITTIVDGDAMFTAVDLAALTHAVSPLEDTYFDAVDGFNIVLSQDVTKGKFRLVAEYLSFTTNTAMYVDLGV